MDRVLLDKAFLKQLDEWPQREVHVKLISLDFNENPRAEIQGYATGGSISVDGSSAVRRTCNITLITENQQINEFDWVLESKFKISIGLTNFLNKQYDNIIWFPQGTYVITSFGSSLNAQGFQINIQGKDKMCLLDGSIGGNIFAGHDFGKLEVDHGDSIEFEPILVYDIIRNAIHEYALEPYENIIINDLEDCSVELLEYRAKGKNLLVYNVYKVNDETGNYSSNIAFEGNRIYDLLFNKRPYEKIVDGTQIYELVKLVTYGDTVGYRLTDLTYPTGQDLILNAGSSITQMLDALIKMLGEFEYFYDLEGRFVFQRKKIYYNVSWTNVITTERETYYDSVENGSANTYEFTKGILIESYNNKPNIANIKNDYTIWGNMIGVSRTQLPVHLRCAIDNKPTYYYPLLTDDPSEYDPNGQQLWAIEEIIYIDEKEYKADVVCDWRELIYRMAYDYSKSDVKILELEKQIAASDDKETLDNLKNQVEKWQKTWDTRYVAYYTDLLGFWRLLYNNNLNMYQKDINDRFVLDENGEKIIIQNPWYNTNGNWNPQYIDYDENKQMIHIVNHTTVPFWIDFCDDAYLEKYTPDKIGRRPKVINDSEVKAIFFEETPNILFVDPLKTSPYTDSSLSYIRLNLVGSMANYFSISTQGKSAKETLDSLLYTHTYYNESITLNCIPIYYLEPNVRISVYDERSGINGEYIIKSYSLQLAYNGSMSITATKAEDLIL